MAISVKDRKILWGLSGGLCAFPGCNQQLSQSVGGSENLIIGEECHIEAQSKNGPRYNSRLADKLINDYQNLILLCPTHHKIVDDNPQEYSVERIKKMKEEHEARVREALDDKSENDRIQYEAIVMYIDMMLDFEKWEVWTYGLLEAQPVLSDKKTNDIEDVHRYIISRVWPHRYSELEEAIMNFDIVLGDLYSVFFRHAEPHGVGYRTIKYYRTEPYDHCVANQLLPSYHRHVFLLYLIVEELTKAGNHLCDMVRKYVSPNYRIAEGKLIIDCKCPEYLDMKKYPGLVELEEIVKNKFPEK